MKTKEKEGVSMKRARTLSHGYIKVSIITSMLIGDWSLISTNGKG